MNVVITGCSRGIGLELTKIALEEGHQVLAVARSHQEPELLKLKSMNKGQLIILPLDVTEKEAPEKIAQAAHVFSCVDLIINNAGVYLGDETIEDFMRSYQINTIAPFFINRALYPLLKKSSAPKSIQISSQMGSISDNRSGSYYAYRSSKAALNMINKSMAIDEGWLTSVVLHPGWVQTRMGGNSAPVRAEESAQGLWKVIHALKVEDSGRFLDFRGKNLEW